MAFENMNTHIEKFKDNKNDKIVIREVEEETTRKSTGSVSTVKPMAGYQSIRNDSSFKKAEHGSSSEEQKEYTYHTETDENGRKLKFRKAKIKTAEPVDDAEEQSQEKERDISEQLVLDIDADRMSASIMAFKDNERDYTEEEIVAYLNENKIVYGIDMDRVKDIVEGKCYYEDVVIATGTAAVDGVDGYYDYTFNPNPETKPIILEDGSVDYNTLGKIELVYQDQLLATYIPSCPGKDGMDIFGQVLKAYEPVDLQPLKLNNVDYEQDMMEYYAVIEGKVTVESGTIKVTPTYKVDGNLDATTGDLDFRGDVIVKGNVFSNVTIKTTGNIIIDGHVEIATLIAGKDILLRNGMQGSGTGKVKCGGTLMAKFLEQTVVRAGGDVNANAILNCDINAGGSVVVSGSRGTILGGTVTAVEKIEAYSLGNRVGLKTYVIVGLRNDFKVEMSAVDEQIEQCKARLAEAASGLERTTLQMQNSKDPAIVKEKMECMRNKIKEQSNLNELIAKKESLADIRDRSVNGTINVAGAANIGTIIIINGISEVLNSEYKNVTFSRTPKEIRIHSNAIDDTKMRATKKRRY